jgi:hypothetical protein
MKKILLYLILTVGLIVGIMPTVASAEELANSDTEVENENVDEAAEDEKTEIEEILDGGINEKIPDLYIKAVNPGYTIDGKSNVGEMIEISRKNSDAPISLAGVTVGYTNSSGNYSTLLEFSENSWLFGETILLRLASSPNSELAALNYTKTIAFKAEITLEINDEILDEVCFNGKDGCYDEFKSGKNTTLVRNLETGDFEYQLNYEPYYDSGSYVLKEEVPEKLPNQCEGLEFSEILSYYENFKTEQFIEIYNRSAEKIVLDGCKIRYKNKNYTLNGIVEPDGYYAYYPREFHLTKNPVSSNTIELVDANDDVLDTLIYANGQIKGTSYAMINFDENGEEIWKTTYMPTPGEANNYQEFKTCDIGKVLNLETGNCVKATSMTTVTKTCKAGYYLNVLTGRCKKHSTTTGAKTCKEGYYLNPETNRCKKIKENNGAEYSLEPENYTENSSFIALYAVIGVVAAGGIYLIYEFRHEILKFFGKVFRRAR